VAKEQGLRSRAAFKLTQINRQHPFLEKCNNVLDLCAAPGGWTQIAAKSCSSVVAVDLVPIRALGPAVTTLVGDITTSKCQSDIRKALRSEVDAVLHDGAPHVGADYSRDAFQQNVLVLSALRCAIQHLRAGGTFVTKVYRSRDSTSLQYAVSQLFDKVHTVKPAASRAASAETFWICMGYKAPAKVDPRLLDPAHIFAAVAGDSTGGTASVGGRNVLDSQYGKRNRGGYDMEHLDASMRHVRSVHEFCALPSLKAAVQFLSTCTGLTFACPKDKEDEESVREQCQFLSQHRLTTTEIKECISDLQVLNQSDFKGLLTWRTKINEAWLKEEDKDDEREDDDDDAKSGSVADEDEDSDTDEEDIQEEIAAMKLRRQKEQKRLKKKERALKAKRRRKAAMDVLQIDGDQDPIFSLKTLKSSNDLDMTAEVNLDQVTLEEAFGAESSEDEDDLAKDDEAPDDEIMKKRREKDLDAAYEMYLKKTMNGIAGTKMAKRSKKLQRQKMMEEAAEDQELAEMQATDYNTRTYAEMLQGPKDSDGSDDDSDSSSEEDEEIPMKRAEKPKKVSTKNPLIHEFTESETSTAKASRWFSNPMFESISKAAAVARVSEGSDDGGSDEEETKPRKKQKIGLDADEVLASMPKTDKQKRHEKRVKAKERDERRQARRSRQLGEAEEDFKLVAAGDVSDDDDDEAGASMEHMTEEQKRKVQEARDLIAAGMGKVSDGNSKELEIVPVDDESRPLPRFDDRKYNDEDYDSDDHAQTLALGTMMLRRSKEKALVDASYNRYAWNDPADLPEWFVDDETRHHRPQLPIPPALVQKMKDRVMALSAKPIKKVAEARARKNKRAKLKLAAAKKKAEAVAKSSDMTEAMKLRAISKALRGQEARNPGKSYVVAKRGKTNQGGKGVKLVDKRMRSDKRALERIDKKKKHGKRNKLVGSKRRRQHS